MQRREIRVMNPRSKKAKRLAMLQAEQQLVNAQQSLVSTALSSNAAAELAGKFNEFVHGVPGDNFQIGGASGSTAGAAPQNANNNRLTAAASQEGNFGEDLRPTILVGGTESVVAAAAGGMDSREIAARGTIQPDARITVQPARRESLFGESGERSIHSSVCSFRFG